MVSKRVDGNAPFVASVALEIGKNGLEVRKLWPPEVKGEVTENFQSDTTHSLFLNPSKNS
jgi:hypothetical protein